MANENLDRRVKVGKEVLIAGKWEVVETITQGKWFTVVGKTETFNSHSISLVKE
jgi:hypothetical protein